VFELTHFVQMDQDNKQNEHRSVSFQLSNPSVDHSDGRFFAPSEQPLYGQYKSFFGTAPDTSNK
jgi:hypothetical protein